MRTKFAPVTMLTAALGIWVAAGAASPAAADEPVVPDASGAAGAAVGGRTFFASPIGDDANPGTLERPWRTFLTARRYMKPGDTLLIADGEYPGGVRQNVDGEPGKPITYKAINPGRVIVRGDQTLERDAFVIMEANWIVVDGLVLQNALRDGIWVAGSSNCIVRNCVARNNGVTGIFTSYSDDLLIENNECYGNVEQHGIYFSNGGDRPVLRNNICHHNGRCGIQLNGDGKFVKEKLGTRGDGIIMRAFVDSNILYDNGQDNKASAINLFSVRESTISNNLIYNNLMGGISLGNDNRIDQLQWGAKDNYVVSNTIVFRRTEGRWCISLAHGCTGNVIENNILNGGGRGAYQFDATCEFKSDYNVLYSAKSPYMAVETTDGIKMMTTTQYLNRTGNDTHSVFADPKFVNQNGPSFDFHLRGDSPARGAGILLQQVSADADGSTLPDTWRPDIGCYGGSKPGGENPSP